MNGGCTGSRDVESAGFVYRSYTVVVIFTRIAKPPACRLSFQIILCMIFTAADVITIVTVRDIFRVDDKDLLSVKRSVIAVPVLAPSEHKN